MTKLQLADTIKRKINEKDSVLTNPSVIIRFQNLKVTVLGEVNREGPISVPGERVTILEAIGLAGGIKDWAMKDSVKVIRELDGKERPGVVDMPSNNLFESPYYNLMQNDVIVVEPSKRKAKKTEQEMFYRQAAFVVSLITAIAVVITGFPIENELLSQYIMDEQIKISKSELGNLSLKDLFYKYIRFLPIIHFISGAGFTGCLYLSALCQPGVQGSGKHAY